MTPRSRIAVLASGGGSNFRAVHDYLASLGERRAADIVVVATNRPDAGVIARADAVGAETAVIESPRFPRGTPLYDLLESHDVDLVVLAGYLALVPPSVVARFAGRMINVHPALLPDHGGQGMYGDRVHRAVIAAGESWSGPSVHYVDEVFDHGALIAQWPVPVLADDDARTLATRVLRAEHALYPRVVQVVASRRVRLDDDGRAVGALPLPLRLPPLTLDLDDAGIAAAADRALAPLQSR